MDELSSGVDLQTFSKFIEQYSKERSFSEIAKEVATKRGATEAGMIATAGEFKEGLSRVFEKQVSAGKETALKKSKLLTDFAVQLQ